MKSSDNKSSTYFDFNKENNKEGPKFKVDSYIRISKYKRIFPTGYVLNWSEEVFIIKKVKKYCRISGTYVVSDLNGKEYVGTFCEKALQKIIQKEFRV